MATKAKTKTKKKPVDTQVDPKVELQDNLERILLGVAKAHVHKLENTDPGKLSAADLMAAGRFLGDNAIRMDTLGDTKDNFNATIATQVKEAMEGIDLSDETTMVPLPVPRLND